MDVAAEKAFEKSRDQTPLVLGDQAFLLDLDIFAFAQHGEGRGIGRGTANAQLLHALDQSRFRIARRRLGKMLGRVDLVLFQRLSLSQRRQAAGILVLLVVLAFLIKFQEAVEADDLAGGAQIKRPGAGFRLDFDGGALQQRRFHLARDHAGPDQFIEFGLIRLQEAGDILGQARHVGRTDRLMRLLGVLRLDLIFTRDARHIFGAEFLADHRARGRHRLRRDIDAIGTHVGDEARRFAANIDAFIKALGEAHGVFRRHAQFARGLLLQGGGGERRIGMALGRLGLDRLNRECRLFKRLFEIFGLRPGANVEPGDFLAISPDEAGGKGLVGLIAQKSHQRPIFARLEFLDFQLAVANQPQRDRLHPASGFRAGQFAPQYRGKVEADQIIQRAAGEIGLDQAHVDLARMFHRLQDGVLGDGVEHHALDRLVLQYFLGAQDFEHVPGNGLSLAIRIGGEDDAVRGFDQSRYVGEALAGLAVHFPQHFEIIVWIDRAVLGRQIAHMAERGYDLKVLAQIFVDRLGLGGRFDDDDVHAMTPECRTPGKKLIFGRGPCGPPERAGKWASAALLSNGPCALPEIWPKRAALAVGRITDDDGLGAPKPS